MKLVAFLIADDIREEIGGKLTVVGIYTNGLGLDPQAQFPAALPRLSVLVHLEFDLTEPIPQAFEVRLVREGEQVLSDTRPLVVRDRNLPVQIRLNFVPFHLTGWGSMRFEFSFLDEQRKELAALSRELRVFANPGNQRA